MPEPTYELSGDWGSLEELIESRAPGDLRLDLGCGWVKPDGFIGIDDLSAQPEEMPEWGRASPDIFMDLNRDPLPFADSSVDEISSSHFLEHSNLPHVFTESHRVLKPDGIFRFAVPYANSAEGMYPGHNIFLTERWFHENILFQELFRIEEEHFDPARGYQRIPRPLRALLPYRVLRTYLFNVCWQMRVVARAKKDASAAPAQAACAVPVARRRGVYRHAADGIATDHLSPFAEPEERDFAELYDRVAARWFGGQPLELRWRAWLLTRFARRCAGFPADEPADFAEFGTWRGGFAELILSTTELAAGQRMHLFDTFAGTPGEGLTERERELGMEGRWQDTSPEQVREALSEWEERIVLWPGDVRETVATAETGPLAFAHLDLNAADPTVAALEYALERLVTGGIAVFDDYGYNRDEYLDQRRAIDRVLARAGEEAIALPTGQAVLIRRGGA